MGPSPASSHDVVWGLREPGEVETLAILCRCRRAASAENQPPKQRVVIKELTLNSSSIRPSVLTPATIIELGMAQLPPDKLPTVKVLR